MGVSHGLDEDPPELFVLLLKGHGVNDGLGFCGLPGGKSPIRGELNKESVLDALTVSNGSGRTEFPYINNGHSP